MIEFGRPKTLVYGRVSRPLYYEGPGEGERDGVWSLALPDFEMIGMNNKVWNRHDPQCPKDAIYVGRPTLFGNPFSHLEGKGILVESRREAVERYEEYLNMHPHLKVRARELLRGQDLVCSCVEFGGVEWSADRHDCHCFILMEIANS